MIIHKAYLKRAKCLTMLPDFVVHDSSLVFRFSVIPAQAGTLNPVIARPQKRPKQSYSIHRRGMIRRLTKVIKKMERRTIKIGAPENRIIYAVYAFVLTPRDDDLLYPVFGPVLTAPI